MQYISAWLLILTYDGDLVEFGQFSEPDLRVEERKRECALGE